MTPQNEQPELVMGQDQHHVLDIIRRAVLIIQELHDCSPKTEDAGDRHSRIHSDERSRVLDNNIPRLPQLPGNLAGLKAQMELLLGTSNSIHIPRGTDDEPGANSLRYHETEPQRVILKHFYDAVVDMMANDTGGMLHEEQEWGKALVDEAQDKLAALAFLMQAPFDGGQSQTLSSLSRQLPDASLPLASHRNGCRVSCTCACHRTPKTATPSRLSRVVGQLFVGYAGIPVLSTKCDSSTCINARRSQLYVEYWFPLGLFWSRVIRLRLTYQAQMGPSLLLRILRRVPDSAPAVSFAMNGNIEGLKELFSRGAASPQDVSDTRGYSLIRWALYSRQYDTVRFLHAAGADLDHRPKAPHDNSPSNKAADAILMGGLPLKAGDTLSRIANWDWAEEQDFPLLHRIVLELHGRDFEDVLMEHSAAIDKQDALGRTALNWAAARGDDHIVGILLGYGADPNILDTQHSGPLSYASENNHTNCARLLLRAGAHPDPVIPGGQRVGSPLNCASRNASDPALVKLLLDFGANVDACGVDGRTPLIHAARTDNVAFARLFLQNSANTNAMSTDKQTHLTAAIIHNSHGVLKLLLGQYREYIACPAFLETVAQFADQSTLAILGKAHNIRLGPHTGLQVGAYQDILRKRHDAEEKLERAFADFLVGVRG
ncbi:ankyrin repeat protein [Naviculisporaceae sp. PSN 640]